MWSPILNPCLSVLLMAVPATATPKKKPQPVVRPDVALVQKIQNFYDSTNDLSADFIQTYTRVAMSRQFESRGVVQIKKPGMMRWDYKDPEEKHFIADGKQLFIYEPEEEQVIIDPNFEASQLTSSLGFLWGKAKISDAFEFKLIEETTKPASPKSTEKRLELKPKKDATYAKLELVVDGTTGLVTESILYESAGNTNHFKFRNIKRNTGIQANAFTFVPPPGVEIVRRP